MAWKLTSEDEKRIAIASHILLSPFEFDSLDEWRSEANRVLKELLGAEAATFMFPGTDEPELYSEEFGVEVRKYPDRVRRLDARYGIWEKQIKQGIFTRESLWYPHRARLLKSEYYNEYVVPLRAFDTIGMTFSPSGLAGPSSNTGMLFHHDSPRGRRFSERERSILRILFPSMKAGVRTYLQHMQKKPSLRLLRERFGLTLQQARVARLLAERYTNREIAEKLHISEHTARRHTEAVLAGLGVSAREDVRGVLAPGRSI